MSNHFSAVRRDPSTAARAIAQAVGAWRRALDAFASDVPVEVVALADMLVLDINNKAARHEALPDAATLAAVRRLGAHLHEAADVADAEAAFASGQAFHEASRRQGIRALAAEVIRIAEQIERAVVQRAHDDQRRASSPPRA